MTMVEALVSTNRSFPRILYGVQYYILYGVQYYILYAVQYYILYGVQYYIGKLINVSLHEKSRRRWDIFNEKGFKYFFILK